MISAGQVIGAALEPGALDSGDNKQHLCSGNCPRYCKTGCSIQQPANQMECRSAKERALVKEVRERGA